MRLPTVAVAMAALVLLSASATAAVFYHETFDSLNGWVGSEHQPGYGKVTLSAGNVFANEQAEQGLHLPEDSHFYAVSSKLPTPISNEKKDLVVSFSVKNQQLLKCGGGYIKLLSEVDQEDFHGESDYWLMFGPDRCGNINRIHIIFNYKGKNLLWKKSVAPPVDRLTHVYTLHITPENTYELFVDGESKAKGGLEDDWDFLPPRTIPDPNEKKPDDWDDEETIESPDDKKPEDWDDEPAVISDPDAVKPESWDDEEDGEWEAPEIPNPAYRGEWHASHIPNPAYKGPWKAKHIPNPEFTEDKNLYRIPATLNYVGIDIWQVDAGSIFDNIIIGDDIKEVLGLVDKTYGVFAEKEKALVEAYEKENKDELESPKTRAEILREEIAADVEAEKAAERARAQEAQEMEDHEEDL